MSKKSGGNTKWPGFSKEEISLWKRVINTVIPMPGKEVSEAPVAPGEHKEPEKSTLDASQIHIGASQVNVPEKKTPVFPYLHVGDVAAVDRKTGERLQKGNMRVEKKLDLHGMREAEAHEALIDFVHRAYKQHKRCLLVITGKGARSEGGKGLLQDKTPRWLNAPELRKKIIAITYATQRDGGHGALYVLLKRQRNLEDKLT